MSRLIKRARRAGRILRLVPFLRMASLNGSIVRGEETPKSDIDILIIAQHGRIYTCRFFATLFIQLAGLRRYGRKINGRICLNCYLSNNNPSIYPEHKKSAKKVAFAYKYSIALVDEGEFANFIASNRWFDEFQVTGSTHSKQLKRFCFKNFPQRSRAGFIENILKGKFGDFVEKKLLTFQQKRILSGRQRGDEIFVSDLAIKLHPRKH